MKEVAAGQRISDAEVARHPLTLKLEMMHGNVCTPRYLAERAKELADEPDIKPDLVERTKPQ